VTHTFLPELIAAISEHRYCEVADPSKTIAEALLLMKRQTWNTNRAVVVVEVPETPSDFTGYMRRLRTQVARRCRFFPVPRGIGIQAVVVAPGLGGSDVDPSRHVARIDNQWAIVQSVFLVDPETGTYRAANSWGQLFTGAHQDAINTVPAGSLRRHDA